MMRTGEVDLTRRPYKFKDDVDRKVLLRSIDREYKVDGSFAQNPTGQLRLRLENGVQGRYEVKWIKIPNTIYNINSTNNQLSFATQLGGPFEAALEPKNYTASELATALTQLLTTGNPLWNDPDLIVTYDQQKLKLVFGSNAATSGYDYFTIFTGGERSINRALGFPHLERKFVGGVLQPQAISFFKDGAGLETNDAPYMVQLSTPLSIGLSIREATSNNFKTAQQVVGVRDGQPVYLTKSTAAALVVPFVVEKGAYTFLSSDVLKQYLTFARTTKTLTFEVVDLRTGTRADLNNADWELYMQREG
jgi:hypothetical protein